MRDTYIINGYLLSSIHFGDITREKLATYLNNKNGYLKNEYFSNQFTFREYATISFVLCLKMDLNSTSHFLEEFKNMLVYNDFFQARVYLENEELKKLTIADYVLNPNDIEKIGKNLTLENWNVFIEEK